MKKVYTKPVLAVESFQLDVAVASCSGENAVVLNYSEKSCNFAAGSMIYFTEGNSAGCNFDAVNPNEFGDAICYHGYNSSIPSIMFIAS